MLQQQLVITGATGHIGTKIVHALLGQGHRVVAVANPSPRLDALWQAGAEIAPGDFTNFDFLTQVLRGAEAAFLMAPPDVKAADVLAHHAKVNETLAQAVQAAGLRRVVNLSSARADQPANNGPLFLAQEKRLNGIAGLTVAHLRPAYFMENLLNNVRPIQMRGAVASPMRPDISIPMVATKDIAAKAAELLGAATFENHAAHYLLGPRNYSMREATTILGQAIGQPELPFQQLSYDESRAGLLKAGMSASMADLFDDMIQRQNNGTALPDERRPDRATPTTLEEFARTVFAPAFQKASEGKAG